MDTNEMELHKQQSNKIAEMILSIPNNEWRKGVGDGFTAKLKGLPLVFERRTSVHPTVPDIFKIIVQEARLAPRYKQELNDLFKINIKGARFDPDYTQALSDKFDAIVLLVSEESKKVEWMLEKQKLEHRTNVFNSLIK